MSDQDLRALLERYDIDPDSGDLRELARALLEEIENELERRLGLN